MIRLFTKRILILEFQALTTHDDMTCHYKCHLSRALPPSLLPHPPLCIRVHSEAVCVTCMYFPFSCGVF